MSDASRSKRLRLEALSGHVWLDECILPSTVGRGRLAGKLGVRLRKRGPANELLRNQLKTEMSPQGPEVTPR